MKFLGHRIADKRVLRYVKRFLKAGIMEEGAVSASDKGTPQGGIVSPILANIYLHYSLDLWFTRVFQGGCYGQSRMIRYADDFVVCFQREVDAIRFRCELEERLFRFGLEISPEKAKTIEFGPFAEAKAKKRGGKAATFDFLGFTHYWARTRIGYWVIKRKTAKKKMRKSIVAMREWCRNNRHKPLKWQRQMLASKLRGHFQYFGVRCNMRSMEAVRHFVIRGWQHWLSRRSHKSAIPWDQFKQLLEAFPLPMPKIVHNV